MNEADVQQDGFYWVWIDPHHHRLDRQLPPQLIVAQASWYTSPQSRHDELAGVPWTPPPATLNWEGCGTDEGVRVLTIVSKIEPPQVEPPR
jgi:hypothetical protein